MHALFNSRERRSVSLVFTGVVLLIMVVPGFSSTSRHVSALEPVSAFHPPATRLTAPSSSGDAAQITPATGEPRAPLAGRSHLTPLSGHPQTPTCFPAACNLACVSVAGMSASISSNAVTLTWADSSNGPNKQFANTVFWGPNPNSWSGSANSPSTSYTISPLPLNTVEYFVVEANAVCQGINFGAWSSVGCAYTDSAGGGLCPIGTLGVSGVSIAVQPGFTSVKFTWAVTPGTLLPTGNTAIVSVALNGQTHTGVSSPYVVTGLSQNSPGYDFWINASAPGYQSISYEGNFATTCPETEVTGNVYIAQAVPPKGIFGAEVYNFGTIATTTDANGDYTVLLGCNAASYSLTSSAVGYFSSLGPVTGSLTPGQVQKGIVMELPIYYTTQPGHAYFDYDNFAAPSNPTVIQSQSVQNPTFSVITGLSSTSYIPAPPSGSTSAWHISGKDISTGGQSYVAFDLGRTPSPFGSGASAPPSLSGPTTLSFYVLVLAPNDPTYPSLNSHFAIDAKMSDGNWLDSEIQSDGAPIYDAQQGSCSASDMTFTVDYWETETCDLSQLSDLSITDFLITYDNPIGGGNGQQFNAFFDSVSLVNPTYPSAIVNGNFELPNQPDGWAVTGPNQLVTATTGHVFQGAQSLQLGSTSKTGGDFGTYTVVAQDFRVQNSNIGSLGLTLSFAYQATTQCASCGSSITAFLWDATLGSQLTLVPTGTWSPSKWTVVSFSLSPNYEGHLMTLKFELFAASGYITFAYVDDVQLLTSGMQLSETGSTSTSTYSGTLILPGSVYRPSCGVTTGVALPESFAATGSTWQDYNGNTSHPVESNISLGIDTWGLTNLCTTPNLDQLDLGVTAAVNSTGDVWGWDGSNNIPVGLVDVYQLCLWATLTQSGYSVPSPWFGQTESSYNFSGVGPSQITGSQAQDSAWGFAEKVISDLAVDAAVYAATGEAAVVEVAMTIVIAFAEYLASVLSNGPAPNACSGAPAGAITELWYTPTFWDQYWGADIRPTFGQVVQELSLDVGCNTTQSCSGTHGGGTYSVTIGAQALICQFNFQAGTCDQYSSFETDSTAYALTLVTN